MVEAVDCCEPSHWLNEEVGRPGGHDGGLPEFDNPPCRSFDAVWVCEMRTDRDYRGKTCNQFNQRHPGVCGWREDAQ